MGAAPSEWPVGQRIFERGIPLFPQSTVCRGTDLVKYAVTKGTLTMASTAWMKSELVFFKQTGDKERARNTQDAIDLILKQFGRKQ